MSTDNRTTLHACDAITGWAGAKTATLVTATGLFYQNTGSLSFQFSNADSNCYTTSIGGTRNLSASTVYFLVKDMMVEKKVNGGIRCVLSDTTNIIAYGFGGSDVYGCPMPTVFNSFKFDVSNSAAFLTSPTPILIAGTEAALNESAITEVGFGSKHLSKAQGSVDNCYLDRFSFIVNTSPALTISGGTSGTPMTLATVAADDVTNGWGLVSNPKGSEYVIFGTIEIGITTASTDSYFNQANSQIYLDGTGMGTDNMFVNLIGSTGTNSFVTTNCVFVSLGAACNFTLNPAAGDIMQISNSQFVDCGTFVLPAQSVSNKYVADTIFSNCGQVDPSTCDMDRVTFKGTTNANGALWLDEATADNMSYLNFVSDGTGHAIQIRPTGAGPFTYTFDHWTFSNYGADTSTDAVVYINPVTSTANVTINVASGDTPTYRKAAGYTGTLAIVSSVTLTVSGVTEGTPIVIIADETVGTITKGDVILSGNASSAGILTTASFNYQSAFNPSGLDVIVRARSAGVCLSARQDDGGVFTNYTAEANSDSTNDVLLVPAVPAANDAFYLGHFETFAGVKFNITTGAGAHTGVITWEYYNGATWASLSGVADNTNAFKTTGEQKVTWTIPGDWATNAVNGVTYYHVRARISTLGASWSQAKAKRITLNVTRYLPYSSSRTITSSGLSDIATWLEDTISTF